MKIGPTRHLNLDAPGVTTYGTVFVTQECDAIRTSGYHTRCNLCHGRGFVEVGINVHQFEEFGPNCTICGFPPEHRVHELQQAVLPGT